MRLFPIIDAGKRLTRGAQCPLETLHEHSTSWLLPPHLWPSCLMYTQLSGEFAGQSPVVRWYSAVYGALNVHSTPPQSQRVLSVALMLTGLAIAAIAILADTINIGTGRGFGYYQMIVLIAGIVIFLIGILVIIGNRPTNQEPEGFTTDPPTTEE